MTISPPRDPRDLDYQQVLEEIAAEVEPLIGSGKVADYIPALACVAPDKFGIAIKRVTGESYRIGDAEEPFSVQSISKVFTLTLAASFVSEQIWQRLGREPSGNPFNSLIQLEYEQGIPRNPFINAGAIVVADIVVSNSERPRRQLLDLLRTLTGKFIDFDEVVAHSEAEHGFRNRALVNFMKSFGNIEGDVERVLDFYFHQCSLTMSCRDLADAFLFLAHRGTVPATGERIVQPETAKRINAVMLTCGLYDAVGDFAFRVGLPGKSGVGGGIVAVVPDLLTICAWSPGLDPSGNSLVGVRALELFTRKTGVSIFE